jgi:putative SOS response-associated peptidase YedK
MCGRYALTVPARLKSLFPKVRFPAITPRYNVAPTQEIVALRNNADGEAAMMVWGMGGHVNARSETVAEKPSFADAFEKRRAIVFADGYYEWQTRQDGKQPYFISRLDEQPFAFAALWEGDACTLMTMEAAPSVAAIHDRMPVILTPEFCEAWLDAREMHPLTDLVARPVSTAVNKVSNDSEALIKRVEPPQQGDLFG